MAVHTGQMSENSENQRKNNVIYRGRGGRRKVSIKQTNTEMLQTCHEWKACCGTFNPVPKSRLEQQELLPYILTDFTTLPAVQLWWRSRKVRYEEGGGCLYSGMEMISPVTCLWARACRTFRKAGSDCRSPATGARKPWSGGGRETARRPSLWGREGEGEREREQIKSIWQNPFKWCIWTLIT